MSVVKATAEAKPGVWLGSGKRVDLAYKCRCSPVRRCAPGCKCLTKTDPSAAAIYCCARPGPPPAAAAPASDPDPAPTVAAPPPGEDRGHMSTTTVPPVVDKWDFIKAVMADEDLTGVQASILQVLAAIADVKTCEIPPQRTPSLRVLSKMAKWDKSTIVRNLDDLDDAGWIDRIKPSLRDAQQFGIRTKYRLTIPGLAGAIILGDPDEDHVAQNDQAMSQTTTMSQTATTHVAQDDQAGRTKRQSSRSSSDQISDQEPSSSEMALRPDVERICAHLADRMVANGCLRPQITKRWRDAARLMIDRDGRDPDKIIVAIDWATADDFWKPNILSIPKLREKYDQLRLAAQRPARASPKNALVERDGMRVRPQTAERMERRGRWAAADAADNQPNAIGAAP